MLNDFKQKEGIVIAIKANYFLVDIKITSSKCLRLLCTSRTKLRFIGFDIAVGDLVELEQIDLKNLTAVIFNIKSRTSLLTRPSVANVTDIFIVVSVVNPPFDVDQVTRFLLTAEQTGQTVSLILTKQDLIDKKESKEYENRIKKWGYEPFLVSIKNHSGISVLLEKIRKSQLAVFCGPSGVGKSSLINYLLPELSITVGQLSKKLNRGKHTTRNVQLFSVGPNSLLADTPGFNRPDLIFSKSRLAVFFPELRNQFSKKEKCKFRNCLHLNEPGCVIDKNWERYFYYKKYLLENITPDY